jgi:hypothetical protein
MPNPSAHPPAAAAEYVERLHPSVWMWLVAAALGACAWVIFLPVDPAAAAAAGLFVGAAFAAGLLMAGVVVGVRDGEVVAGKAHVPVRLVATVEPLDRRATRDALGPQLDARSMLRVRPWVHSAVRITLDDPDDPVPAWIVSTRRPEAFATAVAAAKTSASG